MCAQEDWIHLARCERCNADEGVSMCRRDFLEAKPLKLEKTGHEIRMKDHESRENNSFTNSVQEVHGYCPITRNQTVFLRRSCKEPGAFFSRSLCMVLYK